MLAKHIKRFQFTLSCKQISDFFNQSSILQRSSVCPASNDVYFQSIVLKHYKGGCKNCTSFSLYLKNRSGVGIIVDYSKDYTFARTVKRSKKWMS